MASTVFPARSQQQATFERSRHDRLQASMLPLSLAHDMPNDRTVLGRYLTRTTLVTIEYKAVCL